MPGPRQPNERVARREALAARLAAGITTYPVVPEIVAEHARLRVHETADGFPPGAFGALVKLDGLTFQIMLSARCHNSGHRRFTLSHELGHYFMPDHLEALFDQGAAHFSRGGHFRSKKDWWEVEADTFAAELLVPSEFAHVVVRETQGGLNAVREIETRFEVSISCAAVRYAAVTPDPVLVVLSHRGKVEWTSRSETVQAHEWSRRLGRGEWAAPRSATAALTRADRDVAASALRVNMDVLSSWIDGAPAVPIREEALGLGEYGRVLTVLTCEELPTPEEQERLDRRRAAGPRSWREGLRDWGWDELDE